MPTIDVLVNNAGIQIRGKQPQDYSLAEWHRILDTNLTSGFLCARAVHPVFKRVGGGKIINIGSLYSFFSSSTVAAYSASKGGLVQFTKSLAVAWARDNVTAPRIALEDQPKLNQGVQGSSP